MSIFRLIRGELQKILLRPLMYIITIVLAVGLVGSIVLFNNTIHDRQDSGYSIAGEDKSAVFSNFISSASTNKGTLDAEVESAHSSIEIYTTLNSTPSETVSAQLKTFIKSAIGELESYKNNINSTPATETDLSTLVKNHDNLRSFTEQIRTKINDATGGELRTIIIKKTDFDNYIGIVNTAYNYLNSSFDTNSLEDHKLLLEKLNQATGYSSISGKSYFDKLETLTNSSITDCAIDAKVLTDLETKYTSATTYLTNVKSQIDEQLNDDKVSLADYKTTVLKYYYTCKQYVDLVDTSIKYYPVAKFSDSEINQMLGYKNINTYELEQSITRNAYMIEHNLTDNTTSSIFSPGISFSNSASSLDLVYFGLEICGFIIIVLCIALVSIMIARENAQGTLRLQCLRPYSKNQILSSKILATIFLGFILLMFSAVVLFFAGWIICGLDFTTMLAVFNAECAFLISPIAMIFIYIGLFLLKMIFYVMLSAMIASLFRNDILAIIIPLLIYVLNAILAFVFTSTFWYAYVPFACVDLFKFFGGGFTLVNNPISIILSTKIFYNTSLIYSVGIFGVMLITMIMVSHISFYRREIR